MEPVSLVADRFVKIHDEYVDLATGDPVRLRLGPAGPLARQIEWAERCAVLSALRHPALNPLIDYGAADTTSTFEAYHQPGPVHASTTCASRLMAHAARFLDAHGVQLDGDLAELAIRKVEYAPAARCGRLVGLVVQPRRALDAALELLDDDRQAGVRQVCVAGGYGSGLRTLRLAIAHGARARGFVPLAAGCIARWPRLASSISGRHLCVFAGSECLARDRAVVAALLARLAIESARRHACFMLYRKAAPPGALPLEPMGVAAMTSMVYIDRRQGPLPQEVFAAARKADGYPGRLLATLRAATFYESRPTAAMVHESPAAYVVDRSGRAQAKYADTTETVPAAEPALPGPTGERCRGHRRIGRAAAGAAQRAVDLSRRGRHAAALRLLSRAVRVLEARGDPCSAVACLLERALILRARGEHEAAASTCEHARRTAVEPSAQVAAAMTSAVCWTDEGRLLEAEGALRTTLVAASSVADGNLRDRCALALARALYWRMRTDDALEVVQPLLRTRASNATAIEARIRAAAIHLLREELPEAMRHARSALDDAVSMGDLRLQSAAHRVLAAGMTRAGDLAAVRQHVSAGLSAAATAHLPLHTVKLRATLLNALRTHNDPEASRLGVILTRMQGRARVPPLVRLQIAAALGKPESIAAGSAGAPRTWPGPSRRNVLEDLLAAAHRARDDSGAMEAVVAAVFDSLGCATVQAIAADGRVLATTGRPWRERTTVADQAIAARAPVLPQASRTPAEAAGPIHYAEDVIGAIACRWPAGQVPDRDRTAGLLRAASLAIAPHLGALLDTAPAELPPAAWTDLIGESEGAVALRAAVQRAARAPFPVLIEGESGSGKEVVARAVHRLSSRRDRRFCAINCAAITDELVEAELFGHARGAFTGAAGERPGLFEEADGGTLFLDEVGELSARAQAKLLRVLQDGEVRRVGENLPRKVDVRIVAATNRRLADEVEAARFRADLRFRLDVIRVAVPPLRDRVADIAALAVHFWRQATGRVGSRATLSADALSALSRYDWPGNVRELQNVIAWMAVHAPARGRVGADLLPAHLASAPLATGTFEAAREEFERRFVRAALATAGGQRGRAARALGMSRQGLAKMLRRLGIE
jgi:transcriptional regulator with AAA-type ATPase domain/tetratricopeptide (TPR) repeat protein